MVVVIWENELGKPISEHYLLDPVLFDLFARTRGEEWSHCLQYIEAYSDVTFGGRQIEHLIWEIQKIKQTAMRGTGHTLDTLDNFIKSKSGEGYYLKFAGD